MFFMSGGLHVCISKETTQHEYEPLECIVVDYKGPLGTSSVHHCNGFYLISDHRTGGVWAYPLSGKDESILFPILRQFYIQTVLSNTVCIALSTCPFW